MTQEMMALAAVLLLIFMAMLLFFAARVKSGHQPDLRPLVQFTALKKIVGRAAEAGQPLHLAVGTGSMGQATSVESLAGLYILDYLGQQAARAGPPPIVSMADPTVMLFAQNALRAAYGSNAAGAEAAFANIRWLAPQPVAYAAGVMSLLNLDDTAANVMVGDFGDEYLLMGETSARLNLTHIGGASNPNTLPFIYASAQQTLLGEEIYAAGAYLQQRPTHIGSLLAQDTVRWLVGLVILGGVLMATLGR